MRRLALAALLALGLGSCRSPKTPAPAPPPAAAAATPAPPLAQPQFTFAAWSQAQRYIKEGKVIQTVSGRGGFSLILADHTWVHLVAKPGDPLPKNPKEYIYRNAPNAGSIRHTKE
jgi:hypothetical protein